MGFLVPKAPTPPPPPPAAEAPTIASGGVSAESAMAQARARNAMGAGFNGTEKTGAPGGTEYGAPPPTAAEALK
jgi:hypothetical protein